MDYITPQERQAYLKKLIKMEEEREEIGKLLKK
jgi:hypothetical protein